MIRQIIFIAAWLCLGCHAREKKAEVPVENSHHFRLGDDSVEVLEIVYPSSKDYFFIQLHDNEETAVEASLATLSEYGGHFVHFNNGDKRNIRFRLSGTRYEFDPNRMFTAEGREQTLRDQGAYSEAAAREIEKLATFILSLIPPKAIIIAIHNNTNNRFSIRQYRKARSAEAKAVHINEDMDPDDFIYTTDSTLYAGLAGKNISVVLQDNANIPDDGSLSFYMGKLNRIYINVEAQHFHEEEQARMIRAVMETVR